MIQNRYGSQDLTAHLRYETSKKKELQEQSTISYNHTSIANNDKKESGSYIKSVMLSQTLAETDKGKQFKKRLLQTSALAKQNLMNDPKLTNEFKNQESLRVDNIMVKIERKNIGITNNFDDTYKSKNKNFNKYLSHLSP